jgi:hypothetical protein
MFVYQIRSEASIDSHPNEVLCGIYSSVESIISHFPYWGKVLEYDEIIIIFKHHETQEIERFVIIKSLLM